MHKDVEMQNKTHKHIYYQYTNTNTNININIPFPTFKSMYCPQYNKKNKVREKGKKNSLSRPPVQEVETQFDSPSEQRIAPFCTPSFFGGEQVAFSETPSHAIDFAQQVDCSKFDPKLEGDHLKYRVHFGEGM